MSISNLGKRLIAGFTILPVLFLAICLLPQLHYLAFFLIIVFVAAIGTYEVYHNILKGKEGDASKLAFLGLLLPVVEYIQDILRLDSRFFNLEFTAYALAVIIGIIMAEEIFYGNKYQFKESITRISRTIFNVVYPNFFAVFLVKLIFLPVYQNWYISLFLALVFISDTFAYFTGMLFGKNNKGFIKASPNKSIAGYIGGLLIPAIVGLLCPIVFKNHFTFPLWAGFILGLVTAFFSCIGDLMESILKRASGIKDSGHVIPGRGGILDSIDSIIVAVPAYLLIIDLIFKFLIR